MPSGVYERTDEMRKKKTGIKQSPETIEKRVKHFRGKKRPPFSKEWCENISKGRKGIESDKKDKTYIEMYGEEKAKKITEKLIISHKGQHPKTEFEKGNIPWNKDLPGCFTEKSLKQMSESSKGQISPMKDKNHRDDSRQKMRESRIKDIKSKYGGCCPNYNKEACKIFERLNLEFGFKLQHAENYGERCVIGYFLDAYEPGWNFVIEYDERYHNNKNQQEKDRIRDKNIKNELNCEIIRINKDMTWEKICSNIYNII